MTRRPDIAAILVIAVGLSIGPQAGATVVTPPDDGCSTSRDLGEIELETDSIPADGDSCVGTPVGRLKISALSIYWQSREVPVLVIIERNRAGYELFMTSLLSDPRGRHPCWSRQPIPRVRRKTPEAARAWVERTFGQWASTCSTTLAVGPEKARRSLAARQFDFEQGLSRLARVHASRFGPPDDVLGIGTFHPKQISQGLLDAVADACEGPRDRLKLLPNGAIDWSPDDRLPHGADGTLPFDSCVDQQIRYFPGYPKRT